MKPLLVALVLTPFWVVVHKTEESLANQRGGSVSKEETLNKSKRLTTQDSFSSQAQEQVAEKDKSQQFLKRSLKILKHLKSDKDKEEAYKLLVKAAEMGNRKAMEKLAANMLFGYNGPQNIKAAVSLYEILAAEGSHKGQTALGFLLSYGIGVEHNEAKALLYYTFASIGGNLISKTILGYRFWRGINVPRNCEAALINYRKVARFIAKRLEKTEDLPVEKVRLMEKSENQSSNTELLDWDVYQYYRFLAERGDTQIQVFLGHLHLLGRKGLEKDHAKAFYYFLKAATAGDANGMAFLGKMYLEGSTAVAQDYVTALKYFRIAADKGNPFGLCGLGLLYLRGRGVQVNYTEAFQYFQKAAEKGCSSAHLQLGVMYHTGTGVRKDYKVAFQYFYLASQQGEPLATYHLAEMYATGSGVLRSCQTAVELYRTVCELGRWSEKFLTAYFAYQAGQTDPSLLHYLFLAEMGYEIAQINSAYIIESDKVKIFHQNQIYPLALLLWNRAATQGNAFARVKMGDYHYYGFGTERDYFTAMVHYSLAADQHSAQAMFNLGYMCEHGLGISKDMHLARRWYSVAAKTSPEALIPVFLASIKLEAIHLLSELQLLNGTSVCQALLVGSVVILLCSSRAFYNLVTVVISRDSVPSPFNYGWDNLSDQAQGEEVSSEEYVVFGVVLFLWEVVPTLFVVLFFRAQRLSQNLAPAGMINSHSFSSRAYFFDNPRRYDSDDDLPRLGGGRGEGGSLATPPNSGWYGSLTESDNGAVVPPSGASAVDAAPLLLAHGGAESKNQHNFCLTPQN